MIEDLVVKDERALKWERWIFAHREFMGQNKKWMIIRDLLADRRTLKRRIAELEPIEGELEPEEEAW